MSVAGGLDKAIARIRAVGGRALQIFTRNQRQWTVKAVALDEAKTFRAAWDQWGDHPVFAHASYLINPASPDPDAGERSASALALELERCRALGISWVVLHPGSHLGAGIDHGVERAARCLDAAFSRGPEDGPGILLENTAGQGTALGGAFAELGAIIRGCAHPRRLGVCLDTCHAFASGWDVGSARGWEHTLEALDSGAGLDRLNLIHVNDSLRGRASRVDRHGHIGEGRIGLAGFGVLVNHPALHHLPMVLETPKGDGDGLDEDARNLATLRGLLRQD